MSETINPATLSVGIGFPCGPQVPWQTALSLAATTRTLADYGVPAQIHVVAGNSSVTDARNVVLTQFLKSKDERLFWIDSDIQWTPNDFVRMLVLSRHHDVIAAAYPLKRPDAAIVLNGAKPPYTVNSYGLLKVESLGIGFSVMSRAAVEKWADTKPWKKHSTHGEDIVQAFRIDENAGEDINCFNELRALGYDVWLDPSVSLGHIGTFTYQRDVADALGITITKE